MKALVLIEHLSTNSFLNFHEQKLTENARLSTSLSSARFKLSGSSFLVTILVSTV